VTAILRRGVLDGVTVACADAAIAARLRELGAVDGDGVLVHVAPDPAGADGVLAVLDGAWDAIRVTALPPAATDRLIVLIAPPPGTAHRAAARAGLENLARTLSIEWSRYAVRPVAILPGEATKSAELAELVAFLASRAGAYYAGCAFTLR
jgi:NAD(P)-dependent dehydrogenase (short-subunit alcohol dehydrogenase family)